MNRSSLYPHVRRVPRRAREDIHASTIQHLQSLRAEILQQIPRVDVRRLRPVSPRASVLHARVLPRRLPPPLRLPPRVHPRLQSTPQHAHRPHVSVFEQDDGAKLRRRARVPVPRVHDDVIRRFHPQRPPHRRRERIPRRKRLRQRRTQITRAVVVVKHASRDPLFVKSRAIAIRVRVRRPRRVDGSNARDRARERRRVHVREHVASGARRCVRGARDGSSRWIIFIVTHRRHRATRVGEGATSTRRRVGRDRSTSTGRARGGRNAREDDEESNRIESNR